MKDDRRQKSEPNRVILHECVYKQIYCLSVHFAGYFLDFSTCCK